MDSLEVVPPEDDKVVAWRLGRVEKALEQLVSKLDSFQEVFKSVTILQEKVSSLEKSRDRFIGALAVVSTGTVMLIIREIGRYA